MTLDSEEFDGAVFRGISLEPEGPVMNIEYAWDDQGGIGLRYHFRISCSPDIVPILELRHVHDSSLNTSSPLGWGDLPNRVKLHASQWLSEQERVAAQSKRKELSTALTHFKAVLSNVV